MQTPINVHETDFFKNFDDCIKDYLNNKDYYQIKTLKGTCKINLLVDTRKNINDLIKENYLKQEIEYTDIQWRIDSIPI